MAKKNKKVDQIRQLYHLADNTTRRQWQKINQKGYEFAHDEQLAQVDKDSLEEQLDAPDDNYEPNQGQGKTEEYSYTD